MSRRPMPSRGGSRRRTSADLDALLDGGRSGDPRLDAVLSAARAPGSAAELATPAPALDAGIETGPAPSRRVLARLGAATLVTKAVVGVISAAMVGATAVAGVTHHLPGQTRHHAPVVSTPTVSDSPSDTGAPSSDTTRTSATPSRSSSSATSSPSGSASASGAASLPALCRVWLALPPAQVAVRREPRFVPLVRAAGGILAVDAYCRSLPTRSATRTPSSGPPSTSGSRLPSSVLPSTTRRTPTPTGSRTTGR